MKTFRVIALRKTGRGRRVLTLRGHNLQDVVRLFDASKLASDFEISTFIAGFGDGMTDGEALVWKHQQH